MMIKKENAMKYILIFIIQGLLGIYSFLINFDNQKSYTIVEMFVNSKSGRYFDIESYVFSLSNVLNLLNIIISIFLISLFVSNDFKQKRYYVATRYGNFKKFYFKTFINCIYFCIASELSYDIGILVPSIIKGTASDKLNIKLLILQIFNSLIVLMFFATLGSILSLLYSEKTGMLISSTIFIILVILVALLPSNLKQYDIVSIYYAKDFLLSNEIFTYKKIYYYLPLAIIVLAEYLTSCKILKKDTL